MDADREPSDAEGQEQGYFAIGAFKLAVLSICTLGLYEFYWFFRNWQLVLRRAGHRSVWLPLLRSLLATIFCYALFRQIRRTARMARVKSPSAAWMALAWIGIQTTHALPGRWTLVSLLSFVPLWAVQGAVKKINRRFAPGQPKNERFSPLTVVACLVALSFSWAALEARGILIEGAGGTTPR